MVAALRVTDDDDVITTRFEGLEAVQTHFPVVVERRPVEALAQWAENVDFGI